MRKAYFAPLLMVAASAVSQTVIDKTDSIKSVDTGATAKMVRTVSPTFIQLGNPCTDCTVLAIYDQKKLYSKTLRAITDTLSMRYNYTIQFDTDSIRRYTSEPKIKNVISIEKIKPDH